MQYHAHWLLLVTQLYLYALAWLLSGTQLSGLGKQLVQHTMAATCMASGLLLVAILPQDLMLLAVPYAIMSALLVAGFLYGSNAYLVFFELGALPHSHIWLLTLLAGWLSFLLGLPDATAPYRITLLNIMLGSIVLWGVSRIHRPSLYEFPGMSTWILHVPLVLFATYLIVRAIARLLLGESGLPELTVSSDINVNQAMFYMVMAAFFNMMSIVRIGTRLTRQLHMLSHRDPLTGLRNRRSLTRTYIERPRRYPLRVCVIFVDIDHFKAINDTFGHHIGDEVLQHVGRQMMSRSTDRFRAFRLGGEEFAMVLRDSSLPEGLELAENLRQTLASQTLDFDGRPLKLTASFGVASGTLPDIDMDSLLSAADEALYRAKHNGRNRIEAATLAVSLV
ncbi:GGDEF domain-containing protein [Vogesella mureinivorans]|uniref:GGDEF domain-containing protein n=1 Tax=Vogesella mureinivorans TaxID=657276 RepID=UPI0011C813C7|nr:GGDEF domain-containing protein [Vogesella mureinivorans]